MGGTALYFGKPHPPIYDLARRRLSESGVSDPQILCIGDGIATDIRGGMGEGLDTLFITGGLAAEEFGTDVENPDQTCSTPGLWRSKCPRPLPWVACASVSSSQL
jgi:ribonucleotide monophosphatase NagD (HAD superfamily)